MRFHSTIGREAGVIATATERSAVATIGKGKGIPHRASNVWKGFHRGIAIALRFIAVLTNSLTARHRIHGKFHPPSSRLWRTRGLERGTGFQPVYRESGSKHWKKFSRERTHRTQKNPMVGKMLLPINDFTQKLLHSWWAAPSKGRELAKSLMGKMIGRRDSSQPVTA